MILVAAGDERAAGFEAACLFAGQLAAAGHRVLIDEDLLPPGADAAARYSAAPYLGDGATADPDWLIVIGAQTVSDDMVARLRSWPLREETRVAALGHFADHQTLVAARARLAYATAREPAVVNLLELQRRPLLPQAPLPQTVPAATQPGTTPRRPRVCLFLGAEALADPAARAALTVLSVQRAYDLAVVHGSGSADAADVPDSIAVLRADSMSPEAFAEWAQVAVLAPGAELTQRAAAIVLAMLGAGRAVVDCAGDGGLQATGAPVLRGPGDFAALRDYLAETVVPNLEEIAKYARRSDWIEAAGLQHVLDRIGLAAPPSAEPAAPARRRMVMMPTNGVGLGHAQRLGLIAAEMSAARPVFAAFPSCVPLLSERGFDCLPLVQKSTDHVESQANDLLNHLRLSRLLQRGDRLVFDGGYIFDSVFRLVLERRLDATWVRRGLWQPQQSNLRSLERGRVFTRVIVPDEAFGELNAPVAWDERTRHIGPVVQTTTTPSDEVRSGLETRLGQPLRRLVVSMLGSGGAADRTAQLQLLCNILERRGDCLHLVVAWPGARIDPGLYGWKSTRVVHSRNALSLAKAADLVVTAAGYNSFHEVLYHRIPAIFIPQMAPFMDDQEARARAATERGLADSVMAHELFRLERLVRDILDNGRGDELRAALAAVRLPGTGTAEAARILDEAMTA